MLRGLRQDSANGIHVTKLSIPDDIDPLEFVGTNGGYVGSVHVSDGEYLTVIFVVTLVVVNKTGRVSDKSVLIAGEIWDRTSTKIHREAGAKCISGFSEFSLKFVIGQSDIPRRCESHVATEYVESK